MADHYDEQREAERYRYQFIRHCMDIWRVNNANSQLGHIRCDKYKFRVRGENARRT